MRKVFCDICDCERSSCVPLIVEECRNPIGGRMLSRTIDCCLSCIKKFAPLTSKKNYHEIRARAHQRYAKTVRGDYE